MDRDKLLIIPFSGNEEHVVEVPTGLQHNADKLVEQTRVRTESVCKACETGVVVAGRDGRLVLTNSNYPHLLEFAQRMYDQPDTRAMLMPHLRKAAENAAFAEQRRRREEAEKAALQPPQPPPPPSPAISPPAPARKSGPRKGAKARYRRKGPYVPNRSGSPERS